MFSHFLQFRSDEKHEPLTLLFNIVSVHDVLKARKRLFRSLVALRVVVNTLFFDLRFQAEVSDRSKHLILCICHFGSQTDVRHTSYLGCFIWWFDRLFCFFFREPTLKSKQRVRHRRLYYKFYLERNLNLTDYNENVTNGKEKSTCSKLYTGVQIGRHLANCLMKSNRLCSHSPLCKMLDFYAGCFPF